MLNTAKSGEGDRCVRVTRLTKVRGERQNACRLVCGHGATLRSLSSVTACIHNVHAPFHCASTVHAQRMHVIGVPLVCRKKCTHFYG